MATTTISPCVQWNDSWIIGVHVIDAQHKNLVTILNQFHDAMSRGQSKEVLERTLDSLVRYTQAHFTMEERMMLQAGYPDIVAHKLEHKLLTEKVLNFQRSFEAGRVNVGVNVMHFLGEWLRGHIGGTDKKYVPYMQAKGVS